jgi:broad specificity phosphatase PhoE
MPSERPCLRVGLIRHFAVVQPYSTRAWVSSADYQACLTAYDTADIRLAQTNVEPRDWDRCFSSDLPRAEKTARAIFAGPVELTSLLREIPITPVWQTQRRLPFAFWEAAGRLAWYINHSSQVETRQQTLARAKAFLALAAGSGRILVVSHGGFMWNLAAELKRQGFQGAGFTKAENGRLFVWERCA